MEDFSNSTKQNLGQGPGQPPEQSRGQNLGVAALIAAIVTFVIAVIPCVGLIAIIPGIIAIVLAGVGLSQASRNNSPKGILIAGLIIGIVASLISLSQIFVVERIARKAENKWPGNIENIFKDVREDVLKDLEDANISIKIESDGNKVEINTGTDKKGRVETLEDLEKENTQTDDSLQKKK